MPLRLTATAIKYWFQYRCERQFVYTTMSPEERRSIPILAKPTPAWALEGIRFEGRVVEAVERSAVAGVLRPRAGEQALSGAASLAFLRRTTAETWASQLLLEPTPALTRLLWCRIPARSPRSSRVSSPAPGCGSGGDPRG